MHMVDCVLKFFQHTDHMLLPLAVSYLSSIYLISRRDSNSFHEECFRKVFNMLKFPISRFLFEKQAQVRKPVCQFAWKTLYVPRNRRTLLMFRSYRVVWQHVLGSDERMCNHSVAVYLFQSNPDL